MLLVVIVIVININFERVNCEYLYISELEAEMGLLSSKEMDSTNAMIRLQMDKVHLEKQLERKSLECEELSRSHLNKFSQVIIYFTFLCVCVLIHGKCKFHLSCSFRFLQIKDKEEEILNKLEEVNGLKYHREELESQLRTATGENESLRHRLKSSEAENKDIRERLLAIEPKLQNIEPEFNRLREDNDRWIQVYSGGVVKTFFFKLT